MPQISFLGMWIIHVAHGTWHWKHGGPLGWQNKSKTVAIEVPFLEAKASLASKSKERRNEASHPVWGKNVSSHQSHAPESPPVLVLLIPYHQGKRAHLVGLMIRVTWDSQ